jgi:predicted DNA binding CopG/RHH family protein
MLKKLPIWSTEEKADEWLTNADLSESDFSDAKVMTFELAPKNTAISLRLPADLLAAIKLRSVETHIPMQRLIRAAIEQYLRGGNGKPKRKEGARAMRKSSRTHAA